MKKLKALCSKKKKIVVGFSKHIILFSVILFKNAHSTCKISKIYEIKIRLQLFLKLIIRSVLLHVGPIYPRVDFKKSLFELYRSML
jgi:hypothetical protein